MKSLKEALDRVKRGPTDVVGIDIEDSEIRAVHIRTSGDTVSVLAAEVLPGLEIVEHEGDESPSLPALNLPTKLKGKYAALSIPGDRSIVKLLTFPGQFDAEAEQKVVQNLGIEKPEDYRISYKVIQEGHGRSESKVLAVALPESEAAIAPMLLPSGLPAPFSLEISGLAVFSAFLRGPGSARDKAVGAIDFGVNTTSFALFNKGILALMRRFSVGSNTIVSKVQDSLGVDRETALGIISDGAFDISQSVGEVVEPLIKQILVSRDFVERRENCQVSDVYISGSLGTSNDVVGEMKSALGTELKLWNPFEGLNVAQGVIPDNMAGEEWRFSAAIGSCLATFEET